MTEISIPVSTNVVSFLEEARSKYTQGKINYGQFCNIEMIELGYNPSSLKERKEYTDFIESLSDLGEFEISFISSRIKSPAKVMLFARNILKPSCDTSSFFE